jgi:hypothetical protein
MVVAARRLTLHVWIKKCGAQSRKAKYLQRFEGDFSRSLGQKQKN